MTTLHETLEALSDAQVALLYDLRPDEVQGWRDLAREEHAEASGDGSRVVGLLLRTRASTHHTYTADEDALILGREEDDDTIGRVLGVSRQAIHNRRLVLNGVDQHQTDRDRQALTLQRATRIREEWTPDEDRRLQEYAGPLVEIALELGRTYQAVIQRRFKLRGESEQSTCVYTFTHTIQFCGNAGCREA